MRGHLKLGSGCCQDESLCHTLYRSPPTVDDLSATAEGMALQAYLQNLFRAFFDVDGSQQRPDFWGLREFYSTVRVLNAERRRKAADSEASGQAVATTLEPDVLMKLCCATLEVVHKRSSTLWWTCSSSVWHDRSGTAVIHD